MPIGFSMTCFNISFPYAYTIITLILCSIIVVYFRLCLCCPLVFLFINFNGMFWDPFVSLDLFLSSHSVLLYHELTFLVGYSVRCTCEESFFFPESHFLDWLFVCSLHAVLGCVCVCTLHILALLPFHVFLS